MAHTEVINGASTVKRHFWNMRKQPFTGNIIGIDIHSNTFPTDTRIYIRGVAPTNTREKTAAPGTLSDPGASEGGGYLLSRFRSTIGATGFNFSVRNGKRWGPRAVAALAFSFVRRASPREGAAPLWGERKPLRNQERPRADGARLLRRRESPRIRLFFFSGVSPGKGSGY